MASLSLVVRSRKTLTAARCCADTWTTCRCKSITIQAIVGAGEVCKYLYDLCIWFDRCYCDPSTGVIHQESASRFDVCQIDYRRAINVHLYAICDTLPEITHKEYITSKLRTIQDELAIWLRHWKYIHIHTLYIEFAAYYDLTRLNFTLTFTPLSLAMSVWHEYFMKVLIMKSHCMWKRMSFYFNMSNKEFILQ